MRRPKRRATLLNKRRVISGILVVAFVILLFAIAPTGVFTTFDSNEQIPLTFEQPNEQVTTLINSGNEALPHPLFQVWSHAELVEAVQYIVYQDYIEQVTIKMMQDYTVLDDTIKIPAASVSISTYQLNNYDVNFVDVNFVYEVYSEPVFEVWNHTELADIIQHIVSEGYTEQITIQMMQDFAGTGRTIEIPEGFNIILTSEPGSVFIYTQYTLTNLNVNHISVCGTLTLQNVILSGGGIGGGVIVHLGGHLIMEEGSTIMNINRTGSSGGGIFIHEGTVTMRDGVIEKNIAGSGGGVFVTDGTFIMYDGIIRNNYAYGISFNDGGGGVKATTSSIFTMHGGIIEGNTAIQGGGVSASASIFAMNGTSVIRDNHATGNAPIIPDREDEFIQGGGGVRIDNGVFNMDGGIIGEVGVANTACYGGGVLVAGGVFNMSGGEIQGNLGQYGGGVFVADAGIFNLKEGYIRDNHATHDGGGIFTMRGSNYQNPMLPRSYSNLTIMVAANFSGNTAGNGAFSPPSNALSIMKLARSISASTHQLNNYDINFAYGPNKISSNEIITFDIEKYYTLEICEDYIFEI